MNESNPKNPGPAEGYSIDPSSGRLYATGLSDGFRSYAAWCHFAPLIAAISVIFSSGATFVIPPLVALAMWQIKNDESAFIDDQGKEALNFQISLVLLALILIPITIFTCGIGGVLYIGLPVLAIVGGIMGGIAASKGKYFRYPMCFRVV